MFKKGVSGNPAGKPAGCKSRNNILKNELTEAFERNSDKARKLLDAMFDNQSDFKWLCELKASVEPKEIENKNENVGPIQITWGGTSANTTSV